MGQAVTITEWAETDVAVVSSHPSTPCDHRRLSAYVLHGTAQQGRVRGVRHLHGADSYVGMDDIVKNVKVRSTPAV